MQLAKDSFYLMLRDQIALLNPQRSMTLRGVSRPGVLVEENESESAVPLPDVFRMRWTGAELDTRGELLLVKLRCEIHYGTAGTAAMSGMDRGRMLTEMDRELVEALTGEDQTAATMDYTTGTPVATGTRLFWGDPQFGATEVRGDRMQRVAEVAVWSCEEAGEL